MPTAKVTGAELNYEELGSYSQIVGILAESYRFIAYDHCFCGRSRSPLVVQTRDMVCHDVFALMDVLGIDQAFLGGGSLGAAISFGCAARRPEHGTAIFPSNIAGGTICDAYLARNLFKSLEMAMDQGIGPVIDAFDLDDRFSPFSPQTAQYDPEYRMTLEAMRPEDFAQVMRNTIYTLFDGPYLSLGMTQKALKGIRVPTMIMPGSNDIHPWPLAEKVHCLVPNSQWGEVPRHGDAPQRLTQRVLEYLTQF